MTLHAPVIAETKQEAFKRLRPICRDSLKLEWPNARPDQIEAMLVTSLELHYAGERSRAYRESQRIPLVYVERPTATSVLA